MKWLFSNRWKVRKGSIEKFDKKTRRRYERNRILDLFCTLKNRRRPLNTRNGSIHSSDYLSTWELYFMQPDRLLMECSSAESSSEQPRYQSSRGFDYLNSATKSPLQLISAHHKQSVDTKNTRPIVCPTCRNGIIMLSQKRRSCMDNGTHDSPEMNHAKRMRYSVNEGQGIVYFRQVRGNSHCFNPVYEPTHTSANNSVYSDVCDSLDSDEPAPLDCRPLLVGKRRLNRFRGSANIVLNEWIVSSTSFDKVTDPTYASIASDRIDSSLSESSDIDLIGEPCMSSTLNRRFPLSDDVTVYDEVASDLEESVSNDAGLHYQAYSDVRRRKIDSPTNMNRKLKRMRREYFVCEE